MINAGNLSKSISIRSSNFIWIKNHVSTDLFTFQTQDVTFVSISSPLAATG